jgi:hypothetical protein
MFGSEMNLASKLGEDLAESMEILLTQSAFEALPANMYVCEPVIYQLHDMELPSFRLDRSFHGREWIHKAR